MGIGALEGDVERKIPNGEAAGVVAAPAHLRQTLLDPLGKHKDSHVRLLASNNYSLSHPHFCAINHDPTFGEVRILKK